jgi:hypothetical protein
MNRYSPERKAAILKKLLPPLNMSIAEVSRQENISNLTLYTWRKQLLEKGVVVPDSQPPPPGTMVSRSQACGSCRNARFFEVELSEYCRKKSLFPDQVKTWKDVFLNSQRPAAKPSKAAAKEAPRDKRKYTN